jgi:hypothetical protein
MATSTRAEQGQGKSDFVRAQLAKDPKVSERTINEAWQKAGNEGKISGSLIYKIRTKGAAKGKPGRPKGSKSKRGPGRPKGSKNKPKLVARAAQNGAQATTLVAVRGRVSGRTTALEALEAGIDQLLFELMAMGGMNDVEAALRQVRRLVVLSHRD